MELRHDNFEPETLSPEGFSDVIDLLFFLEQNRPKEDLVFSHGDFSFPNIFVLSSDITELIDYNIKPKSEPPIGGFIKNELAEIKTIVDKKQIDHYWKSLINWKPYQGVLLNAYSAIYTEIIMFGMFCLMKIKNYMLLI